MAQDQSSAVDHNLPVIVLLAVCPLLFVMVIIYYVIIYPLRKERRRKEKRASAEAPRRELHRWIPTLPTPTTPRFSPIPRTPRSRVSGYSFQTGSLSLTPSNQSTRFVNPHSPISEPDMLPISSVAGPLTPPPSALIGQYALGHVDVPSQLQEHQDPFSDPGSSYVRSIEADVYASSHTRGSTSTVTVPPPAASVRSSVDGMSITTSSTIPPSYRTHRPTHRTASDASFSGHARRRDMARTAAEGQGPTSYQALSERRWRHYPRKSVDGGVRLEGGPVDPATGRGPGKPPRYRQKV